MNKADDAQAGFTQALKAAGQSALEDLQTSTAAPVQEPTTPAAPVEVTPPTEPSQEPTLVTPETPVPETFTLKVDGEEMTVEGVDKLKELAQKGIHFTKRSQQVAERDKALNQRELFLQQQSYLLQQQAQQINALLNDPEALNAYTKRVQAQYAPVPGATGPDDVPTAGQVRQALEAQRHEMEQTAQHAIDEAVTQAKFELETARYRSDYTALVESTIGALKSEFPALDAVDDIDDLIKKDVGQVVKARIDEQADYVPSNDELKALFRASASKRAQKLQQKFTDHAKTAVARSAKLAATGTEPPGGTPPRPAPTANYKLGDPRLTALAIQELEEATRPK